MMVLVSSAFSADSTRQEVSISNRGNSYPSVIARNKIEFRFVFTEDVGWVELWIVGKDGYIFMYI